MFALTIDRRDSRGRAADLHMARQRTALQRDLPRPVLDWEISAGDELQALYDDAAAAVHAALTLADAGHWHVGVGIGAVDEPLASSVREATGEAFVAARDAVNLAKERGRPVVAGNEWAQRAGTVLDLVCAVRTRRSEAGAQATDLADRGHTQQEIAQELGITQSSVSRRLSAALWHEEHTVHETLVSLFRLADEHASPGDLPEGAAPSPKKATSREDGASPEEVTPSGGTTSGGDA
ncbi:sigma factor-like helix-turn-helix DNA-binding protein [Kocuria marina]|uniref:sigma factor-like helix-turn-helix DNA-binding protein n=1 Tax=Kocuria marina TaxID=223184 RepID=UPI003F257D5F